MLHASAHHTSMLEWCLDNGAPVQDDICTAIAARPSGNLHVVANRVCSIFALRDRGHACNRGTVMALLARRNYEQFSDSEEEFKVLMRIHAIILELCFNDGVDPTSEHLTLALKAADHHAAEMIHKRDPSLMTPQQALHSFVDATARTRGLTVHSIAPMLRWLVKLGAELSPDVFAIAARPGAAVWADTLANISMLEALRACGCPWDASVTAAVVELACAESSVARGLAVAGRTLATT